MVFTLGTYGVNSLILGWASTVCSQTPEKKAVVIAMLTTAGNASFIYTPYLFREQDKPRYTLGKSSHNKVGAGLTAQRWSPWPLSPSALFSVAGSCASSSSARTGPSQRRERPPSTPTNRTNAPLPHPPTPPLSKKKPSLRSCRTYGIIFGKFAGARVPHRSQTPIRRKKCNALVYSLNKPVSPRCGIRISGNS